MRIIIIAVAALGLTACGALPGSEISQAKELVARRLIDPESAQFRDIYTHTNRLALTSICGEVNGKNRMGGYVGFQKFFVQAGSAFLEPTPSIALSPLDEAEAIVDKMDYEQRYNTACIN